MKQKQQNSLIGFLDLPLKDKKKVVKYAMEYAIKKQQEEFNFYTLEEIITLEDGTMIDVIKKVKKGASK